MRSTFLYLQLYLYIFMSVFLISTVARGFPIRLSLVDLNQLIRSVPLVVDIRSSFKSACFNYSPRSGLTLQRIAIISRVSFMVIQTWFLGSGKTVVCIFMKGNNSSFWTRRHSESITDWELRSSFECFSRNAMTSESMHIISSSLRPASIREGLVGTVVSCEHLTKVNRSPFPRFTNTCGSFI